MQDLEEMEKRPGLQQLVAWSTVPSGGQFMSLFSSKVGECSIQLKIQTGSTLDKADTVFSSHSLFQSLPNDLTLPKLE